MRFFRIALGVLSCLALVACTSATRAPVIDRGPPQPGSAPAPATNPVPAPVAAKPVTYTVKAGDTLYAIALDNGQDYRDIAAWNNLDNPNLIRAGQVLRVQPLPPGAVPPPTGDTTGVVVTPVGPPGAAPPAAPPAAAAPAPTLREPKVAVRPYSDAALTQAQADAAKVAAAPVAVVTPPKPAAPPSPSTPPPAPAGPIGTAPPAPTVADNAIQWAWPMASVRVLSNFSGNNKGVDLVAKVGDPVLAAAPGRVIYSGTGLRGYGQLIIIRHNPTFLSAYAHNSRILVKQDQSVQRGEKIAEAGQTDSDTPKLHFEIRQQGTPVDPLKFLPPRS